MMLHDPNKYDPCHALLNQVPHINRSDDIALTTNNSSLDGCSADDKHMLFILVLVRLEVPQVM